MQLTLNVVKSDLKSNYLDSFIKVKSTYLIHSVISYGKVCQFDSCLLPNVQSQMNQSLSTLFYCPIRPFSFSTFLFPPTYLIEGVFIYLDRLFQLYDSLLDNYRVS